MTNLDKICCHYGDGECKILIYKEENSTPQKCTGWDNKCKFAKTSQQFADDNDKSIDICRRKGLCNYCKYSKVKCKKSTEG